MSDEKFRAPQPLHFSEALAYEVATGVFPPEEVCAHFDITIERLNELHGDVIFRKAVESYKEKLQDEGVTIKLRAGLFLESSIDVLYSLAHDVTVEAKDRLKALEILASLSGDRNAPPPAAAGGSSITMVFTNDTDTTDSGLMAGDLEMELDPQ